MTVHDLELLVLLVPLVLKEQLDHKVLQEDLVLKDHRELQDLKEQQEDLVQLDHKVLKEQLAL